MLQFSLSTGWCCSCEKTHHIVSHSTCNMSGPSTPFRGGRAGADTGFMKRGGHYILNVAAWRRVAPISPREARKKFFAPSFFTSQDGLSWHLRALHCKSRCTRFAGPRAAMSFFLAQISLTNVIRTYTEGYTRSWSPSQAVRFQATHGIASPGQELQRSGSKLVRRK